MFTSSEFIDIPFADVFKRLIKISKKLSNLTKMNVN